jgi:hypothetical protein
VRDVRSVGHAEVINSHRCEVPSVGATERTNRKSVARVGRFPRCRKRQLAKYSGVPHRMHVALLLRRLQLRFLSVVMPVWPLVYGLIRR